MVIVSLNQLDMTQEELRLLEERLRQIPLEELNEITIQKIRASECMTGYLDTFVRPNRKTNTIDVIPLEELHSSDIGQKALAKKYNVHREDIAKYRKKNGIKNCIQYPLTLVERVPLHELLDSYISGPELASKYNVNRGTITEWRKERGVRYTGKKRK
jgi:hypothetical protein